MCFFLNLKAVKSESSDAPKTEPSDQTAAEGGAATAASSAAQAAEGAKFEEQAFAPLPATGPLFLEHKYTGTNPLLVNITDYLVDEMNAEEEELLSSNSPSSNSISKLKQASSNEVMQKWLKN